MYEHKIYLFGHSCFVLRCYSHLFDKFFLVSLVEFLLSVKIFFLLVSLVEFLVCDKNFLGLSCWIPLFRWFFCWFLYDGEKFLVGSYLGSFSMEINFWLVLLLVSLRRGESFSWFFFGVSEKSSVGSLLVSLRNL